MERQIKFRGKRADTGEWTFGSLVKLDIGYIILINEKIESDNTLSPKNCIVFSEEEIAVVIPDTVGQFTGLLDKNEREIYDGDFLAVNGRLVGYVVGGVRGYCYDVVYTPPLKNGESRWSLYGVVVNDHPNEIEINGSVHDNPELMEGGEE